MPEILYVKIRKDELLFWTGNMNRAESCKPITEEQLVDLGIRLNVQEIEEGHILVEAGPAAQFHKALTALNDEVGTAVEWFNWGSIPDLSASIVLEAQEGQHVALHLERSEDRIMVYP